jgi:nucleoid DNA-binding protein
MADNKATKPKAATKSEMFQRLSEGAQLSKKQVQAFFDELTKFIQKELSRKGPGIVTIPGLLKIKKAEKGPTPARQGINPLTKQPIMIKAKPKRTVVRVLPLKGLKEMVKK